MRPGSKRVDLRGMIKAYNHATALRCGHCGREDGRRGQGLSVWVADVAGEAWLDMNRLVLCSRCVAEARK